MSLTTQLSSGFVAVAGQINTLQHPITTRTLSHSNGGIGGQNVSYNTSSSTEITLTAASIRIPIRLLCTTTQWRLKLRNYDSLASATKTALTLDGIAMGAMAAPATGATAQTGSFDSNGATTIVTTSAVIPGDGTFYTSPWVTAPGAQFQQGKDQIVAAAFHAASSLTMQTGIGLCWYWSNNTAALSAAVAGSAATNTAAWIPIDWVLEYEVTNRQRAYLIIGDSITEGTTGPAYALTGTQTNAAPTPLWHRFWDRWGARRNVMVQVNALYASAASAWASPTYTGWLRQATGSGLYDGAALALGANDIKGGQTLSQLQASYTACITNLRAIVGNTVPLYAVTVMAESMTGSTETVRLQFNSWLTSLPAGITEVIDFDSAMRSSATNALDTALTCDTIHPSYQGQAKLTDVLLAAIP